MHDMNHDVKDITGDMKLMLAFIKESAKANNLTDKNNELPSPPSGGDGT